MFLFRFVREFFNIIYFKPFKHFISNPVSAQGYNNQN